MGFQYYDERHDEQVVSRAVPKRIDAMLARPR
jgi:hypothetical protein